jgi:hypothetical protein
LNALLDLVRLYLDVGGSVVLIVSPWVAVPLVILVGIAWNLLPRKRFKLVKLDVKLGGIGSAEIRPTIEDVAIAHRIWTELVTRKAAIPIDTEHDVILEVYDSWYSLFGRVRELVGQLPPELVRDDAATKEIIRIAIESLNLGLRPHLTRWQARFRNWYSQQSDALKIKTPQEVQRDYPDYDTLIADMRAVNIDLIQYAAELQKITHGARS